MSKENEKANLFLSIGTFILGIVIFFMVVILAIYFGCEIKKVNITGNDLYEESKIKDVVLNDTYSWNSVYVFLKYRFQSTKELPFIDTMEVSIQSPNEITINVYEKDMVGYLYVDATGQYAYFDRDGIVQELSTNKLDKVCLVEGLNTSKVEIYNKLETDKSEVFKNLLTLELTLDKYELKPGKITVSDENYYLLSYGDVLVNFGAAKQLNDKILRLVEIMPQLTDQKGTLHLEEWTSSSSTITFEKSE